MINKFNIHYESRDVMHYSIYAINEEHALEIAKELRNRKVPFDGGGSQNPPYLFSHIDTNDYDDEGNRILSKIGKK